MMLCPVTIHYQPLTAHHHVTTVHLLSPPAANHAAAGGRCMLSPRPPAATVSPSVTSGDNSAGAATPRLACNPHHRYTAAPPRQSPIMTEARPHTTGLARRPQPLPILIGIEKYKIHMHTLRPVPSRPLWLVEPPPRAEVASRPPAHSLRDFEVNPHERLELLVRDERNSDRRHDLRVCHAKPKPTLR